MKKYFHKYAKDIEKTIAEEPEALAILAGYIT